LCLREIIAQTTFSVPSMDGHNYGELACHGE